MDLIINAFQNQIDIPDVIAVHFRNETFSKMWKNLEHFAFIQFCKFCAASIYLLSFNISVTAGLSLGVLLG